MFIKRVLLLLIIIHGIIHLLGFFKVIVPSHIPGILSHITRIQGFFWLLTAILITGSSILFFWKVQWWFVPAIIGAVLSQILIIMNWQEAKFGTIVNFIILLMAVSAYGKYDFRKQTFRETETLLKNMQVSHRPIVTEGSLKKLPPIVQKWLRYSGVEGKPIFNSVVLKQEGRLKTKPEANWMPYTAIQYVNVDNTSFLWDAKVIAYPLVDLYARDELRNAAGSMLIKINGIIPVVDESENSKINSGSMLRFLGEICWFPFAALKENISWESINENQAKAVLNLNDTKVSGVFSFSEEGKLLSFEAERFFGTDVDAQKEKWLVEITSLKDFNGYIIPNKSKVTWKLKDGDFTWLELEIVDIQYGIDTTEYSL